MGWYELFDALSVFDWISPTVGMAKDAHYNLTSNEGKTTIWLNKKELNEAKNKLSKAGINVVSDCMVAGNSEAGIDIPNSQVDRAKTVLYSNKINNW